MNRWLVTCWLLAILGLAFAPCARQAAGAQVDLTAYEAGCQVKVQHDGDAINVSWPAADGKSESLVLDISGSRPLIRRLGPLADVDPAWWLTVGERRLAPEKPPEQKWEVFFDNPHQRPHEVFASQLDLKQVRVTGQGSRATISLGTLTIGPFAGTLDFTFYAG